MTKMVEVTQQDANNYCLILRALGMEDEGDPVEAVKKLIAEADQANEQAFKAEEERERWRAALDPTTLSRFLSDVTTAAGLLEHGKRDKGLAKRMADRAQDMREKVLGSNAELGCGPEEDNGNEGI